MEIRELKKRIKDTIQENRSAMIQEKQKGFQNERERDKNAFARYQ